MKTAEIDRKGWDWAPVPADVIMSKVLNHSDVRVYAYLLWRSGKKGLSWPNVATISEDLGMSEQSVRLSLKRLIQDNWILRERRYGRSSMTYIFERQKDCVKAARSANRLAHESLTGERMNSQQDSRLNENHVTKEIEHLPTSGKKPNSHQSSIGILESKFSGLTGLPQPKRDSDKDRRAASERWWLPLGEILTMCDKDTDQAWRLIESSYKKLTTDKMTVSAPKSLINTAIALRAQGQGRKVINIG